MPPEKPRMAPAAYGAHATTPGNPYSTASGHGHSAAPMPQGEIQARYGHPRYNTNHAAHKRAPPCTRRAVSGGSRPPRAFSNELAMHEEAADLAEWIIEQVADAMIYADRDGNIQRWNQAATRLFGFSAEDALGQNLNLIIPEHLRDAHWAGYNEAMTTGQLKLDGRPTLTRGLRKQGGRLYVEMTFALVKDADGKAVGAVAMARDVTERTEKEKAARGGVRPRREAAGV